MCTTDIFFCHICFEWIKGTNFPNKPHSKQDPHPLRQQSTEVLNKGVRSKFIFRVFLLFDINVLEWRSLTNKVALGLNWMKENLGNARVWINWVLIVCTPCFNINICSLTFHFVILWKGYLKTWNRWNSQRGTYNTPLNP